MADAKSSLIRKASFLALCLLTQLGSVRAAAAQITVTGGTTKLAASTSSTESLNIPAGTAPSSAVSGAVFFDTTELYFNDRVANQPHPRTVRLASDQSSSSTTMANLPGISFSMASGVTYTFTCDLYFQVSATTSGLSLTFTGPSGTAIFAATISKSGTAPLNAGATAFGTALFGSGNTTGSTNLLPGHISGTVTTTASGTLQLQFATSRPLRAM